MYGKKVRLRIVFIISILTIIILSVYIILKLLENDIVYFKSPTEIKQSSENITKKIRVGGMVKKDSITLDNKKIFFIITDFKNEINVIFAGTVPNLFQEEKGVVAEGILQDNNLFIADKILAKHDENYMPPEVKESLEQK
ncbi:MAG: cytochrome c maturation protein CcmE [Candidatus Pelagibacter sp.]